MADESATKQSSLDNGAASAWKILASLRRPFTERDQIWPVRRRVRLRQEDPPVPEAYHGTALRHKTPELDYVCRQISALLGDNKETIMVYSQDDTADALKVAGDAQVALDALMQMLDDAHPIEHPRLLLHDNQVADGVCVEKISFNWDFYSRIIKGKGEETEWKQAFVDYVKKNNEIPFKKNVIDPLTLYWEFDINGLSCVAEYGRARKSALADQYKENSHIIDSIARMPVSEQPSQGSGNVTTATGANTYTDDGETIVVIEVWTRKEFFLLVENVSGDKDSRQLLVRQKHPFKRPPYFFAAGILTSSQNPLHQFQPLVLPLYQWALEASMVRTARLNATMLSSFKPFYVKYGNDGGYQEDEEGGGLKIHFLMPGNNIPSIKGGEIVPINWTNLDELEKMEATLEGDRQRYAFQAILAGNQSAAGESTAWATRMLRDQGMIQFNGVLRNYSNMRREEITFIMDAVRDVIKDDLPINRYIVTDRAKGVGTRQTVFLTEKMCNANLLVEVRCNAGKAGDRIALVEELRRGKDAGELPTRYILEEGWQFPNAQQIIDEVDDEKLKVALQGPLTQIILQLAQQGAQAALSNPVNMTENEKRAASAQAAAQAAGGGQQPQQGEIPGGVAEAGLQQGLQSPDLPPDQGNAPAPTPLR